MSERPKVGVGAIIWKDEKVLLQKRIGAHGEGTWSFPGGHLEFGEEPEACAAREALEEAGVLMGECRTVCFVNDIFEEEGKHYITIYVMTEQISGEPRIMEPDKMTEIGWFDWEDLPSPLFLPLENLRKQGFHPRDHQRVEIRIEEKIY